MTLAPNIIDRIKLITTALTITAIFAGAWYIRDLRQERKDLTQKVTDQAAVIESKNKTIAARNDFIQKSQISQKKNSDFLIKQTTETQSIKHDSEIDPDILGPAYFEQLRRQVTGIE